MGHPAVDYDLRDALEEIQLNSTGQSSLTRFGFAAGAMIVVVVEEVVPESQRSGDTDLPTAGAILGFVVMMVFDVALG